LSRVEDPALRQIIEHVTDEEREHVSEMYQLIMDRDAQQRDRSARGLSQLSRMALLSGTATSAATEAGEALTAAAPPQFPDGALPDGAWSVGTLKGGSS